MDEGPKVRSGRKILKWVLIVILAVIEIVLVVFYMNDIANSWPVGPWPKPEREIDRPAAIFWSCLALLVALVFFKFLKGFFKVLIQLIKSLFKAAITNPTYFLTAFFRILIMGTSVIVSLRIFFAHVQVGPVPKSIALVGLLLFLEDAYTFTLTKKPRKDFFKNFFKSPFTSEDDCQPLAVFDGDRTFMQILGAVSATLIGLSFDPARFSSSPTPARWIMASALFFSILYLNLQGAGVQQDSTVPTNVSGTTGSKREIQFKPRYQERLLLVRSLVYWTFFFGIGYILIAAK